MNQLYFGDNLEILKDLHRRHPEGFIDLIYIDPPFNSKRNYNVLFESLDMTDTKAQKEAFADTWSNVSYLDTLNEIKGLDMDLHTFLDALNNIRLSKGAISYLTTMAIRIHYMHKVLKPTGSFYLHCDPTMSHYLKLVCDLVFGNKQFQNEIIWCYKTGGATKRRFGRKHDVIFFYTKSGKYTFLPQKEKSYMMHKYGFLKSDFYIDERGQYTWVIAKDWWEIPSVGSASSERLHYDTQKPELLLDKIINASSKKGDIVADFFCGCGTTIAVAQKLNRHWIGVDISHLAIKLISKRLADAYGPDIRKTYEIFGFPKDLDSARELAINPDKGRFKFEEWIVEVMLGGALNERKTQVGFDGFLTFDVQGDKDRMMIEVKSGSASLNQLNHFIKTVEDKKGDLGVFVCFADQVTRNMLQSAKRQGYYRQDTFGSAYDKIQLLTVEDLLDGKLPNYPRSTKTTFKSAKKESKAKSDQGSLF